MLIGAMAVILRVDLFAGIATVSIQTHHMTGVSFGLLSFCPGTLTGKHRHLPCVPQNGLEGGDQLILGVSVNLKLMINSRHIYPSRAELMVDPETFHKR